MERRQQGKTRNRKYWRRMEFYLGTWNVLSLYRAGAFRLLRDQIDKYKTGIIAIKEIRWIGQGTLEKKYQTIFYSCDRKQHMLGVGFVVKKNLKRMVMDFEAISTRIRALTIKGKFFNYTIINVHAPTEEKEEIYRPTIGSHSLHEKANDNGYRLIQFATLNNMVISSTMFQQRNIHKPTWTVPDRSFEIKIDHMVIDARHMSDLLVVRSYRGGNVDSDHYLVIARMRARISK